MANESQTQPSPSLVHGHLNIAKGVVYEAIGSVSSDPLWSEEGVQAQTDGANELEAVKTGAGVDRLWGKAQSGLGAITGNQEKTSDGNLAAERGEWTAALADGTLPSASFERVKGKVESAIGMATGDLEKQTSGNAKAEKAEWLQG